MRPFADASHPPVSRAFPLPPLHCRLDSAGRLYRGLVPPLMLEAPKRAVKFAANDFWGKTFKTTFGVEKMTQGLSILTGCSAGATESIVVVPFELVKIRLQDKNSTYKGPMDVVGQIIKKEGLLGMYAGLEPTFWRSVASLFTPSCSARVGPSSRRTSNRAHALTPPRALVQARHVEWRLLWMHLPGSQPHAQGPGAPARSPTLVRPWPQRADGGNDRPSRRNCLTTLSLEQSAALSALRSTRRVSLSRRHCARSLSPPRALTCLHPSPRPVDVVKSRVQNSVKVRAGPSFPTVPRRRADPTWPRHLPQVAGQAPKYNWTFPSLLLIAREEGFGALYSGFLPKVLRLAPGGGVLLLVVEFTLGIFRKQLGPPYV